MFQQVSAISDIYQFRPQVLTVKYFIGYLFAQLFYFQTILYLDGTNQTCVAYVSIEPVVSWIWGINAD